MMNSFQYSIHSIATIGIEWSLKSCLFLAAEMQLQLKWFHEDSIKITKISLRLFLVFETFLSLFWAVFLDGWTETIAIASLFTWRFRSSCSFWLFDSFLSFVSLTERQTDRQADTAVAFAAIERDTTESHSNRYFSFYYFISIFDSTFNLVQCRIIFIY